MPNDVLTQAASAITDADAGTGHPVAADLRTAADSLAAGHDLLQTHFPPGNPVPSHAYSQWAPIIASPPVAVAMLSEMTGRSTRATMSAASGPD